MAIFDSTRNRMRRQPQSKHPEQIEIDNEDRPQSSCASRLCAFRDLGVFNVLNRAKCRCKPVQTKNQIQIVCQSDPAPLATY